MLNVQWQPTTMGFSARPVTNVEGRRVRGNTDYQYYSSWYEDPTNIQGVCIDNGSTFMQTHKLCNETEISRGDGKGRGEY